MKQFVCMAIVTLSLGSVQALAIPGDGELVEVTAPDLSGSELPPSLAVLTGWAGAASGAAAATLKQAAMQQAAKTVAERKTKQQEKKEAEQQEENDFQQATNGNPGVLQTLIHEAGLSFRQLFDSGEKFEASTKSSNGEETHVKDCRPSGALNPNKLTCTEQKIEYFIDPTDGVERYVWSFAVIEGKYNPKHYYADAEGYYAVVVDKQSISLVFDNMEELAWQIARVFPVK